MLRYLATGIAGCVAVAIGIWLGLSLSANGKTKDQNHDAAPEFAQVSTDLNGVPVFQHGEVVGYFVIKVSSVIDQSAVSWPIEDLRAPLMDAAIRAVADLSSNDGQQINSLQLKALTNSILVNAVENLGPNSVKAVHVEQFNFVPKSEIRDSLFKVN